MLESIATGTISEPSPIETPPPVAPPVEPVAETMLPTPLVESVAPPVVDPYVAPDVLPDAGGISSSPISAAMRVLSPSFEGGGGILCDQSRANAQTTDRNMLYGIIKRMDEVKPHLRSNCWRYLSVCALPLVLVGCSSLKKAAIVGERRA